MHDRALICFSWLLLLVATLCCGGAFGVLPPGASPAVAYALCENDWNNSNCLIVDASGKLLSERVLDFVGERNVDSYPVFIDGMLRFSRKVERLPDKASVNQAFELFGFVNVLGQEIVPAKYIRANAFSEGLAMVCSAQGCGYIDTTGREVIALRPQWQDAGDFHDGRALVRGAAWVTNPGPMSSVGPLHIRKPWTVINRRGEGVFGPDQAALLDSPRVFDRSQIDSSRIDSLQSGAGRRLIQDHFNSGVAPFMQLGEGRYNPLYGLMDVNGKVVAPAIYQHPLKPLNGAFTQAVRLRPGQAHLEPADQKSEAGLLDADGRFTPYGTIFKHYPNAEVRDIDIHHQGYTYCA